MRTLLAVMLLLLPALAVAQESGPVLSVRMAEPRGFGYFVGDLLHRTIYVDVADPYRLETATQPKPGRVNYWLDLRSVDVSDTEQSGYRRYKVALVYQAFYVPLSPSVLSLPPINLRFADGDKIAVAEVPPVKFVMAPLREVQPEAPPEGPQGYLRPDAVPNLLSTRGPRIAFAAGLVTTLLALALLAYHEAWWPFRRGPARPFTRAARAIRQLARDGAPDAYRAGLLDLHRAFDASAGHRLLAEDVPAFLAQKPVFRPLQDDIAKFFATSRQAFFGNDLDGAAKTMPLEAVASLGSRLGAAERRAA